MVISEQVKLCMAAPVFFPNYGGAQRRFLSYIPGLANRGIQTRIVTGTPLPEGLNPSDDRDSWSKVPVGEMVPTGNFLGAPVDRMRLPDRKGRQRVSLFFRSVSDCIGESESRPDILQLVTNLGPRAIPWLRRIRALGVPVVYTVTLAPGFLFKPFKRLRRGWQFRLLLNQLDCVLTNSEPLKELMTGIGVKTPIEVIPNGVNLQRFQPAHASGARRQLREALGVGDDDWMITTIGAVNPRKGIDILVEAWSKLVRTGRPVHLFIVGPRNLEVASQARFRRRIEEVIASTGRSQNVHMVGEKENVETYLQAADAFVLASDREGGMPNAVAEAMATGLPVLVTPFIGISGDLGREGKNYLQVERNPDALCSGMQILLDDGGLRMRLGQSARTWIEDTWDVERSLDRYAAVYRNLVQQARARKRI